MNRYERRPAGQRAATQFRACRAPTARWKRFELSAPRDFPQRTEAQAQPDRLRGGACGRRSAGRHRSLARNRHRLGAHDRVPRAHLGPRPRRRRSDGYRAARHGARLADLARTHPPLSRGRAAARRAGVLRRRHRPACAGGRADARRRAACLRAADRRRRGDRRTHRADGLARTRAHRPLAPTTMPRSMAASLRRCASR